MNDWADESFATAIKEAAKLNTKVSKYTLEQWEETKEQTELQWDKD